MRDFHWATAVALVALATLTASPAQATWSLYVSGDIGYSIGVGHVSGTADLLIPPVDLSGSDDDVSPLLGGAFGVEVPMDEITPWRMPFDWRLPDWPMRLELEAVGLREWELRTHGQTPGAPNDEPFNTRATSWSMLTNLWLDVPLRGLHRPISATSRVVAKRSRLPGLRSFLKHSTWNVGLGIGMANLDVKTSDSILRGGKSSYNFAWQVGTGFGYQLTENVNLGVGYRFFRPGEVAFALEDASSPPDRGRFVLNTDVHEARFTLRIRVFDLPYPWR